MRSAGSAARRCWRAGGTSRGSGSRPSPLCWTPGPGPGRRPRRTAAADGGDAGWSAGAAALSGLREVLSAGAPDPGRRARIALSLTHMHANRLLGPRPEQELAARVTAREALALWLGRKRNTG
ncbi:lantibiotic dehydratase C-terminal domain-containing protein [Streptomyces noursei]|uniref:lantibiotic dehydratase C-terminal domain-containing protein n=1 Tax=Streptomyces noursei TaxID=1971 RepID=UPI003B8A8FD4